MLWLVALWSASEAALWFVVADLPISVIAVTRGWRSATLAAGVAALASVAGAVVAYAWARHDAASVAATYARLPAIDPALIDRARGCYTQGPLCVLKASFAGVPFKLFVLEAARRGDHWLLLAAPFVRAPRFLLSAWASAGISAMLASRTTVQTRLALLAAFWTIFYAWYWLR